MTERIAKSRRLSSKNQADVCARWLLRVRQNYSKRRISTGRMRDAERAGKSVAAMLMKSAAAAIHIASSEFAWNGTYGIAYTSGFSGINRHLFAIPANV